MKYLFTQHIPDFVDTESEPYKIEFETLPELYENPKIKNWAKEFDGKKFINFSVEKGWLLIANYEQDFSWVIGYIKSIRSNCEFCSP